MATVAVKGHLVRLGGECSEGTGRKRNGREALGLAQPSPPEWIVTARVEKHQLDALFGLHLRKHLRDVDGGGLDDGGAFGPQVSGFDSRVDWNEPVVAIDLDGVAGVEE